MVGAISIDEKASPGGVATLNENGRVPLAQLSEGALTVAFTGPYYNGG